MSTSGSSGAIRLEHGLIFLRERGNLAAGSPSIDLASAPSSPYVRILAHVYDLGRGIRDRARIPKSKHDDAHIPTGHRAPPYEDNGLLRQPVLSADHVFAQAATVDSRINSIKSGCLV